MLLPLLEQGLWFTRTSAARVLGRFGHRPGGARAARASRTTPTRPWPARRATRWSRSAAQGGSISIAHALHGLPPDLRRRRFDEIAARDRHLGERIERMMRNDELMSPDDDET